MDEKRKVTQEELDNACILHNKYIEGEDGGKQAVFENCSFERLSFNNKQFNSAVFRNCDFKLCDLSDTGMCFAELHNDRFHSCNCYNGNAATEPLYLGKYIVREKTAPYGYVLNSEEKRVELTYAGQEVSITDAINNTFYNDYQGVNINLAKFSFKIIAQGHAIFI